MKKSGNNSGKAHHVSPSQGAVKSKASQFSNVKIEPHMQYMATTAGVGTKRPMSAINKKEENQNGKK